jgi:hypothetical protein
MSAFHKALENVVRVPMFEVHIFCEGHDACPPGGGCKRMWGEYDGLACPTKWDAIKSAKENGWTWDKDGNWWCPKCSWWADGREGGEK